MIRWLAAFAFDWSVIAASIAFYERYPGYLTGFIAIVLIGTRQHALAVLGHESAHGSISKNQFLNDLLGKLAFLPFGISLRNYRRFHFAHHKYLGTSLDPELELKAQAAPAYGISVKPTTILWLAYKDFLIWPAMRETIPFMRLIGSLGASLAAFGFWGLLSTYLGPTPALLWFLSLSTSFWASNRLRIWTEHQGTDGTHRIEPTWWERFLFLPHGIWVHPEHHEDARIPFYRLPLVRKEKGIKVWELYSSFQNSRFYRR